jgi:CCR4-NOT transcription complex subunit 2
MGQFSTEAGARSGVFSAAGTAAASATSMALNLLNLAHGSGTASGQAAGAENGTWGSPYGMLGLLATIRSQNADLSLLAHGVDLTALGLNLNSAEPLYPSFSSPFGPDLSRNSAPLEDTRTDETVGNSLDAFAALPSCYSACTVSLKPAHFKRFSTETLILIFYGYPRDLVQVYAALELFNRGWRYHKELKTWFARSGPGVESLAPDPSDAKSISSSGNQLVYFDLHNWSLKPFVNAGTLPNLMRGFLTEAELREMMAACK